MTRRRPPADLRWMSSAACAGVDIDLFFPPTGGNVAPAKRVCASCPVAADCLNYALTHLTPGEARHGVWGGTVPAQRSAIRPQGRPCETCGVLTPTRQSRFCDPCRRRARAESAARYDQSRRADQ